ncbi:hypothetical protein TpMuguga_01g01164 [Theileria parva strain Muguga]|uniref:Uncharacterized protein n=1 Tax=Theileria parva TaxID=5875 RepID=Q4N6K6_THEPA|nr:uncharacterized protein TpMuguga_01g01164 [Theileria parva strain Muguga]EAN34402.1 hypothetical protein TpMuguga_01g01164 [Theileria parva strain Muguga]|eukprot:XP_766685.1 hypothetical protein [Theileria parva strain Muguga]
MVMPKLPLIVPKRASPPVKPSDSTFNASNTANVTGDNHLPSNPLNSDNNSTNFNSQKLTKLVSNSTLNLKKSPSTHGSVNTANNSNNGNENFYEDLSLRLNSSTILSDLNATPSYQNTTTTTNNNKEDEMEEDEVGYTPWLKVEKRINEIRSFYSHMNRNTPNATNNTSNTTSSNKDGEKKSVYSNYGTKYIEDGWNKEVDHPLKYATIQKLKAKKSYENDFKDNWKFVNGFLRPRRKPFTSISEMSKYYNKVDAKDQYEMIRLLLACRDLERLIEEQHTVLDMLDHDLREARDSFSDLTNAFNGQKLFGSGPKNEPQYPTADVPLFIKGRLSLLPNQ